MAPVGVVGMSEVIVPNSASGPTSKLSWGTPAMWSFIWVAVALAFLFMIHLALLGRR